MTVIDVIGLCILNDRIYPNVKLVFRAVTTDKFTTISISDDDGLMLQIPLTNEIKEELRRVL